MAARFLVERSLIATAACGVVACVAASSIAGDPPTPFPPAGASVPEPYGWPVRPFDRMHAIRSNFGDPRTVFAGPPTRATLYGGDGSFAFHAGVDIAAADGTPVYAVRSGVVTHTREEKVVVYSGNGVSHGYWHIVPAVEPGQRVSAHGTVLGHVRRGYGHVHFTEARHGRAVNPLAPGHLSPYGDATAPRIGAVSLHRPGTTEPLLPELVRGEVEIQVPVYDDPAPAAPDGWATMPTVPALVTWRVEHDRDGTIVVGERSAFDVRDHVPRQGRFWRVFARGTRQNMATFRGHRYWRQAGVFSFRLGVLDTRRHDDGIYSLVVTARDIRGNAATSRTTFLIYNRAGWPPRRRIAAR